MGNKRTEKYKPTGFKGIKQTSETSVQIQFTLNNKPKRVKIKCDPSCREDLAEIADTLYEIKKEIRNGDFDFKRHFPNKKVKNYNPSRGTLLKDYLPYFCELRKDGIQKMGKKPMAESTYRINRMQIEQILIPAFGHICIDEICENDIFGWAEDYGKNKTSKTLSNILSPLKQALDYAVLDKMITYNPIKNITPFGQIKSEKINKHNPFDRDEMHDILMACDGQLHNLIRFAFFTGLRSSELVALTWSDYDPRRKTISVNKAKTDWDDDPADVKTAASDRIVQLSPTAIHALDCQKMHTKLAGKEIFHNPHSKAPWQGSKPIRKQWITVLKNARVSYRKPYQTRHTYASMQLTEGENLAFISEQLGHTDAAFTLRTYASYIQKHRPDAGYRADAAFTDLDIHQSSDKLIEFR